jgi:hypothetical protein
MHSNSMVDYILTAYTLGNALVLAISETSDIDWDNIEI